MTELPFDYILPALLIILFCIWQIRNLLRIKKNEKVAIAKIIQKDYNEVGSIKYEFKIDNTTYKNEVQVSGDLYKKYEVGNNIDISYQENRPENSHIKSNVNQALSNYLIGISFVLIIGLFYYLLWPKQ